MRKIQRVLLLILSFVFILSGCGDKVIKVVPYDDSVSSGISTGIAASNSYYELTWDDEQKCVMFTDLKDGKVWSTIPYEYMLSGGMSANVTSPINITVSDTDTLNVMEVRGSKGAVSEGRVIAEKTENGIKVTYYFDSQKISVPVFYTLDEENFLITLDSENISEASHYKLLSIEIAPFLCSAKNSDENYLFVPSNNGALMFTKSDTNGTRKYSSEVYGKDAAHLYSTPQNYETEIKMPVFGVKDGNNALFAIAEAGDEHITVKAEAGNERTEWSAVWSKITVRGVDVVETQLPQSRKEDISYVSEERINDDVTIRYIPLDGEDADYNGMARCYREYLTRNNQLVKSENTPNPYSITLYGGAKIKKLFLGVPYDDTVCLTSFKETEEIIGKLTAEIGAAPEVQLIGYGKSGINIGEVGGGFGFAKSLGGNRDLKSLLKLCKEKNISYYFDYDIVRYNNSSAGFSATSDVAKTASQHSATLNTVDVALAGFTDEEYHLLSRNKLFDAAEKIIKLSDKKDIKGVSLNSLGNMSYSDYTSVDTAAKGKLGEHTRKIIQNFRDNGLSFSASNANIYSALMADSIFGLNDKQTLNALNQSVPFYQMVLSGSKSMYITPVNIADNPKRHIADAAAYGLGLNFECIGKYNVDVDLSGYTFYGASFEKQGESISQYVKEYISFFKQIQGAVIEQYNMLDSNVSKTVYDNGTTVYVNHSQEETVYGDMALPPYGYKVMQK